MEKLQDLVEHEGGSRLRFLLLRRLLAGEDGFGQLHVPVTIGAPDEVVGSIGRFVELVLDDLGLDFGHGARGGTNDPAIERHVDARRIVVGASDTAIHLEESSGVPELGDEVAVAFDA